ncbi:MAG: hypothetical protein QXQ76_03150 [Candidatus Bathyarchaeia archaeon]
MRSRSETTAKALYKSVGFVECEAGKGYYGIWRDAMVFRLNF